MLATYTITDSNLQNLLQDLLNSGKKVIAPVQSNNKVLFKPIKSLSDVCTTHVQTALSAKHIVFPRTETLFTYRKKNGEISISDFAYDKLQDVVLWGSHPCDAVAFNPLTSIFNWDISDPVYNKRLEKLTIVSFSCTKHDDACFCTSVNGGPGNTLGSDVLITTMANGSNIAEIITEKGAKLVSDFSAYFGKADQSIDKEQYITKLDKVFDISAIKEKLETVFESDVWKKQAAGCLGCGACAYVCPTCACFDIQDDKHGNSGSRLRCWDSCGFQLFTLHTSGHNPRETQPRRWRQRLMHKFSYMPDRLHTVGCSGCGRCSRACPADMNILEHLTNVMNESNE